MIADKRRIGYKDCNTELQRSNKMIYQIKALKTVILLFLHLCRQIQYYDNLRPLSLDTFKINISSHEFH